MWCEGQPVILAGLEEFPQVGYRFEVDGQVWEVVEDSESYVCETVVK